MAVSQGAQPGNKINNDVSDMSSSNDENINVINTSNDNYHGFYSPSKVKQTPTATSKNSTNSFFSTETHTFLQHDIHYIINGSMPPSTPTYLSDSVQLKTPASPNGCKNLNNTTLFQNIVNKLIIVQNYIN